MMAATMADVGHFPVSGPEGREKQLFYEVGDCNAIRIISGDRTPALITLWVSNDVVQFGTVELMAGGNTPQQTEWDEHPGDAVFYVLEGPITFYTGNYADDTQQTFNVDPGDYMLVPEGTRYKIINFCGHRVKAVFAIAPEF